MKRNFNKIIKRIMLAATTSLLASNSSANVHNIKPILDSSGNSPSIDVSKKDKIIKGLFKLQKTGNAKLIAGHRSHSSHRSHRSSSSGGGYSTPKTTTKKSSSSKSGTSSNKSSSSSSSSPTISTTSPSTVLTPSSSYTSSSPSKLGDRYIKYLGQGMDVNDMVEKLLKKGYLKDTGKILKGSNEYYFDEYVQSAFNQFQKDAGLTITEGASIEDQNMLAKWELMNSQLKLGDREIKNINVDFGPDVAELIDILIIRGYEIDKDSILTFETQPFYTITVKELIKDFQEKNGIEVTGIVDSLTIEKLKENN